MISLDALKSRRSPIGEVLHQVVRCCSSRRKMCHHRSPPFAACESKRIWSDKQNESCLSTEDANAIIGCSSGFHAGKRVREVALPICSLTSWYYRYTITPYIAKPVRHTPGIRNLNTSLRTATWNQTNLFEETYQRRQ